MKARDVLDDCTAALALAKEIQHVRLWRPAWVAILAQLRNVGAVLWTEDRPQSPGATIAIEGRFKGWNALRPRIFWEFIRCDRDLAVMEYRSRPDGAAAPFKMLDATGPWIGRSCVDVAGEALAWWEEELGAIERTVRVDREMRAMGQHPEAYSAPPPLPNGEPREFQPWPKQEPRSSPWVGKPKRAQRNP